MSRTITPDERAAMRARYPAGPIHEPDLLAMGMRALDDVPRLLGALDAAEAEVARLRAALPLLTAAPSATREEVARALESEFGCYLAHNPQDHDRFWGGAADALLARFTITPKEDR